jgi:hypothetical protein
VSPKSHGMARLIIRTTVIWEINHVIGSDRIAAVSRPSPEPGSAPRPC